MTRSVRVSISGSICPSPFLLRATYFTSITFILNFWHSWYLKALHYYLIHVSLVACSHLKLLSWSFTIVHISQRRQNFLNNVYLFENLKVHQSFLHLNLLSELSVIYDLFAIKQDSLLVKLLLRWFASALLLNEYVSSLELVFSKVKILLAVFEKNPLLHSCIQCITISRGPEALGSRVSLPNASYTIDTSLLP